MREGRPQAQEGELMTEPMSNERMDELRKKKIWNEWHKDEVLSEIIRLRVQNEKLEKELEKYNLKDYEERHEKAVKGS